MPLNPYHMKKVLLFQVCLFILGISTVLASLPIPSYDVPVYHQANFQEKGTNKGQKAPVKGKRQMNVSAQYVNPPPNGFSHPPASIWIYSLDGHDSYGPFITINDTVIQHDIDDREWGAYVECDDHVKVSIWIAEGKSKLFQGNNTVIKPEETIFSKNPHFEALTIYQGDIIYPPVYMNYAYIYKD
jgi:hypothetical protein